VGFLVDNSEMNKYRQSKNRHDNRSMSLQWTSRTKLTTKRTRTYRDDRSSLHCNRDQTNLVMVTGNIATNLNRGNVHKRTPQQHANKVRPDRSRHFSGLERTDSLFLWLRIGTPSSAVSSPLVLSASGLRPPPLNPRLDSGLNYPA